VDPESGENKLFNVLNAYAHYDTDIGYCQGLNFIVALILRYTEDEEDAFFCLLRVMVYHDWRGCFDDHLSKLNSLLDFLTCVLETAWNPIFEHIMKEIEISLVPAFCSNIQTIFVYECEERVAAHIFDVFLLDGEQVIFILLLKMIQFNEEEILSTYDHDLLDLLKTKIITDCL